MKDCLNYEHCHNAAAHHRRYCTGCVNRKHLYGNPSAPINPRGGMAGQANIKLRKPHSTSASRGYLQSGLYVDHPLYNGNSHNIGQHRLVLFDKIGYGPHQCHWCQDNINWGYGLQADHLDFDITNNHPDNLVASCGPCNNGRKKPSIATK